MVCHRPAAMMRAVESGAAQAQASTLALSACLAGPVMATAGADFSSLAHALEALQDELKCSIWCAAAGFPMRA